MKLFYWDDDPPVADSDDLMLQACIQQGHVPPGCLLGGSVVLSAASAGDPCSSCTCPRELCGGRPQKENLAPEGHSGEGAYAEDARVRNEDREARRLLRRHQMTVLEGQIDEKV